MKNEGGGGGGGCLEKPRIFFQLKLTFLDVWNTLNDFMSNWVTP